MKNKSELERKGAQIEDQYGNDLSLNISHIL